MNVDVGCDYNFLIEDKPTFTITKYGTIYPQVDNLAQIGLPSKKFTSIYCATGTIQTSDERLKTDIQELDQIEKIIAIELKGLIRKYRFKDGNRLHIGIIAQSVKRCI